MNLRNIILIGILLVSSRVEAQVQINYGITETSLSTSSNGAVTGTVYNLPTTYAAIITWSVVADGSALSTTLEGSLDNSTYFTLDTQTTAAGGIKNFGFTAVKYVRISQVSRTGGTTTTGTLIVSRGLVTSTFPGTISAGIFSANDGTAAAPAFSFLSESTKGFYSNAASQIAVTIGSSPRIIFTGTGVNNIQDNGTFTIGVAADTTIGRTGAGQIYAGNATVQPVINGTLTTSTASTCTIADTNETTLWTYTLPANALNADGRGVRVITWGFLGATGNTKTLKLYFGATVIGTFVTTGNAVAFHMNGLVLRSGAATQVTFAHGIVNATIVIETSATAAETMTNAIVIKMTGQNTTAAANDICGKGAVAETIK